MHLDQLLTAYYIAGDGRGICFVRDDLLRHVARNDRLCFYKIDDPLTTRNVYLYYRKKGLLRPAVQEFLDFLSDV